MQNCCLELPDCNCCIHSGQIVKLGRFSHERWRVGYGWYSWGGNREVCGWYLSNQKTLDIKPFQKTDLDDIYLIEE